MRHHLDPSQSEVISHIRRTLDYSEEAAERAFNSMRNPKSGVLLFDRVHRLWYGCDWTPDEEDAKKDFFTQRFSEMKREVAALREEVREFSEMKKKIYKELDSIWETIETGKNGQQSDSTDEDQAARERQQDAAKMQKMWQA